MRVAGLGWGETDEREINMLLHCEHMPVDKKKAKGKKEKSWTGKQRRAVSSLYVNEEPLDHCAVTNRLVDESTRSS